MRIQQDHVSKHICFTATPVALTSSVEWPQGWGRFILLGAELGGEKAPMLEPFSRGGRSHLLRNHRSCHWNRPKLEYITGPINATPEQSFPPRNSIGKVGCCVLLSQRAVW